MPTLEVLTVSDVMSILRCKRHKVCSLIESGQLVANDIGDQRKQYRITRSNLEAFLNKSPVSQGRTTRSKTTTVRKFI